VVDPPLTFTMLQRGVENLRKTHHVALPERHWVDLDDLPCTLLQSALTAEDSAFYQHHGFDVRAIREAWKLNGGGQLTGKVRGASTISQQVARNVFLWLDRSWVRKGLEAYYTVWMELLVPKDRILELYFNVAETGPMTFGVEAGAQHWFHKHASQLTAAEAAGIVAILPSPRKWHPTSGYAATRVPHLLEAPTPLPRGTGCKR